MTKKKKPVFDENHSHYIDYLKAATGGFATDEEYQRVHAKTEKERIHEVYDLHYVRTQIFEIWIKRDQPTVDIACRFEDLQILYRLLYDSLHMGGVDPTTGLVHNEIQARGVFLLSKLHTGLEVFTSPSPSETKQ